MDTYFIVLSVQTGAAYSHLYYITYPSLSLVKCGTLYKGMMLSHAIISKLGGNRKNKDFARCPLFLGIFARCVFGNRHFYSVGITRQSAFLWHNSAIGIFTRHFF